MKNGKIKECNIHILSIDYLMKAITETDSHENAIIICCEMTPDFINNLIQYGHIEYIPFADSEDRNNPKAFDARSAKIISDFLTSLPEEISKLFIACNQGESRSPAIAAAILRISGGNDWDIWKNPYYHPNKLVYKELCECFGIKISSIELLIREKVSEKAFVHLQNGRASKYEKWQII